MATNDRLLPCGNCDGDTEEKVSKGQQIGVVFFFFKIDRDLVIFTVFGFR